MTVREKFRERLQGIRGDRPERSIRTALRDSTAINRRNPELPSNRGHQMGFGAQIRRQCRDDHQSVEMVGVIGIVDPLPRLGCATLPVGTSADQ